MLSLRHARVAAYCIAAALTCIHPPAHGQAPHVQAGGNAEIVGTVSTGVAFDIASQLLTSIFVTGRVGDTVSIFTPTVTQIRPELSVPQLATLDDITILSSGTISVNLQQTAITANSSLDYGKTFFVILAQFN